MTSRATLGFTPPLARALVAKIAVQRGGFGYCVFGRVVEGMGVVDAIAAIPTGPGGPFPSDVPSEMVTIKKATVVTAAKPAAKPPAPQGSVQ